MGETFPELKKYPQRVIDLIKDEEISFGKTLDRGILLFEEAASKAVLNPALKVVTPVTTGGAIKRLINAYDAFKLHDTYGFPIDLTRIMAEERGLSVDIAGYEALMEQAKDLARGKGKLGEGSELSDLPPDAIATLQAENILPTDDNAKYSKKAIAGTVRAIWNGQTFVDEVPARDDTELAGASGMLAVILDRTNFYAEMGGQVGDQGELRGGGANFVVKRTHSVGGYVLHIGFSVAGPLRVDTKVESQVAAYRFPTEQNHTSTHIANWALREVLGNDVQQKGSLVDATKLRFDFSHGKAMSDEEVGRVEKLVAERIERKLPVYAEEAPQERALKISGLRAVFGEKYPPLVRVVSIGVSVKELLANPANEKWREYSIEFCGGTHLGNSAEAEAFVVMAEESVSKGIRRIVAATGPAAKEASQQSQKVDAMLADAKSAETDALPGMIAGINAAIGSGGLPLRAKRRAQAAISELQARLKARDKAKSSVPGESKVDVTALAHRLLSEAHNEGLEKLIIGELPGASDDQLRSAMDWLKKQTPSHAILLATRGEGKVTFVAAVSDDLIAKGLKAGDWVREAAKAAGGGGGGRPQMAQAGGKDPSKLEEALKVGHSFASKFVGG